MLGRAAEAELRHLRLAQRDKAGAEEHLRPCTVGRKRARLPGVRALHRRHALDGHVVLDERRHSVEVAAVLTPGVGPRHGQAVGLERKTVECWIYGFGACDGGLDQLPRRHLACAELLDETDSVVIAEGVIAEGVDANHGPDGTKSYRVHGCRRKG